MTNPFEDPSASYLVLVNDEWQHCLWPVFAGVPGGWSVAFGAADRDACLAYVARNWTDMRPKTLAQQMADNP